MLSDKNKIVAMHVLKYTVLIAFVIILVGPFIWLISSSLKKSKDLFTIVPSLIPRDKDTGEIYFTLKNYKEAFEYLNFSQLFFNTLLVAVVNTIANTFFNSMAGYAFARLEFPGRDKIFKILLISLMVPGTVLLIPQLFVIKKMGLYDNRLALVLPVMMSVYNMFLMRQFFYSIPKSLEEAALIDGASYFTIFWRIALPLAKPVVITLGIFTFLFNYNNFLWPLVVLISPEKYTLPLGLGMLMTRAGTQYNVLLASSVIVALPMIILFFIFQRHIIDGIQVGAVKQ